MRTPDGERQLEQWDTAWFVTGEAGAHGLRNDGGEPARFVLAMGGGDGLAVEFRFTPREEGTVVAVTHDAAVERRGPGAAVTYTLRAQKVIADLLPSTIAMLEPTAPMVKEMLAAAAIAV